MKKWIIICSCILVAGIAGWYFFLKEPVFNATDGYLVNVNEQGVIIEGYDPVAYFTEDKPVKSDMEFSEKYHGATYMFASSENEELFKKEPEKYIPQFGAFCGYAVSIDKLRPVDPTIYQIKNGKLILQHTQEAFDLFNKDLEKSILNADKNWPSLESARVGKKVEFDKPGSTTAAAN